MVSPNITLEYLNSLPLPNSIEELSYETILAERVTGYRARLPEWTVAIDSPLYKIAEEESFREYVLRQVINRNSRSNLIPYARGTTLQHIAALHGVLAGESSDDQLTLKVANRVRETPVTIPGIIALAKVGDVPVVDASVGVDIPGKTITLYALKADHVDLTAEEQTTIRTRMNLSNNVILDFSVVNGAVIRTPLVINLTVFYYASLIDAVTLERDVRAAVYRWIDRNSILNNAIFRDNLRAAATVEGSQYVTVISPANASYAKVVSTVYTFNKTDAADGVLITLTAIT